MKYPYSGLILTLSITIFFLINVARENEVFAAEVPPGTRATESELKYLAIEEEFRQKYEARLLEQEERIKKLEIILTSLSNLVEQTIAEKQELIKKINSFSQELEKFRTQYGSLTPSSAETTPTKKTIPVKKEEVEKTEVKKEDLTKKKLPESTTRQMIIEEEMARYKPVSQYVKVKMKGEDQEMEMVLDPTYTDMGFQFTGKEKPKEIKEKERQTEVKDNIEKIMKRIDELADSVDDLKRRKGLLSSETAPAKIELPKIELTPPPGEPKKEEEVKTPLPKDLTEEVLNSIHRAQKFYYAGKYQDALREVRKSLSKKETALGYALLGSIYFTMGDLDSALDSWEATLEIDPLMTEVSEILERYRR